MKPLPGIHNLGQTVQMFNRGCESFERAMLAFENKNSSEFQTALQGASRDIPDVLEWALKIYLENFPELDPQDRRKLDKPVFRDLMDLMEKYGDPPLRRETRIRLFGYRAMRNKVTHQAGIPPVEEVRNAVEETRQIILTYFPGVEEDHLKRVSGPEEGGEVKERVVKEEKSELVSNGVHSNSLPPLPPPVMLFFNLVGLGALAFFSGLYMPSRCVSPIGVGLSLAIVELELIHLIWRYLGETLLSLVISIASLKIPIGQLAAFFERLHPRALPGYFLWTQAIVFFVIAGFVWFPPWSPFSNPEAAPSIRNFLVHPTGGQVETYALGSLLQIERDTSVLVEARVSDQPDISCVWSTTMGTLLPATGCATQYSPPIEGNRDTLTIRVQSPCKTYQAFAGLNIEIGR